MLDLRQKSVHNTIRKPQRWYVMDEIEILYKAHINARKPSKQTGVEVEEEIAYEKLISSLSKKQRKLLLDYIDPHDGTWIDECAHAYRNGFQSGMRLLTEAIRTP